jgi:hypothetical protein
MSSTVKSLRLCCEDVALILKCQSSDIATLVTKKLLKPLGDPQNNATKYFSIAEIERRMKGDDGEGDRWLSRVTNAIYEASREKNSKRTNKIVPFNKEEVA